MKVVTLVLLLGLVGVSHSLEGGHLGQLFHGTAFFGVVGLTLLSSIHHLGLRGTLAGLAACLLGRTPSPESAHATVEFRRNAPTWAMYASSIMAVLGIIQVMSMLNDPAMIGPGAALTFLSYLYGGILVLVLGGTEADPGSKPAKASLPPITAAVPGLGILLLLMTILFALQDGHQRHRRCPDDVIDKACFTDHNG